MKTIRNLLLVLALTVSFTFGDDGHTGNGNRCDTCPPPCTENCGGFAAQEPEVTTETGTEEYNEEASLFESWTEMFFELIG